MTFPDTKVRLTGLWFPDLPSCTSYRWTSHWLTTSHHLGLPHFWDLPSTVLMGTLFCLFRLCLRNIADWVDCLCVYQCTVQKTVFALEALGLCAALL